MKFFVLITIFILICLVGYFFKEKYKRQKLLLEKIDEFLIFYKSKIVVSKSNVIDVINEYKIMQNNKNANLQNIFENNDNLYKFNEIFAKRYIFDENLIKLITAYFENIGSGNQEFELEKVNGILEIIKEQLEKTTKEIQTKGEVGFKLFIAIGLVVLILLW